MTRLARLLAGAGAALAIVLAVAAPASAHATLEKTDPSSGTVLASAPTQVAAQFDEAVGVSPDSLRVYSPDGARVDDGTTTEGAAPDIISVNLRANLGRGTYTVAWHVISADTHPVSGAFTFSVGVPSRTSVNPNTIITKASWDEGALFGIARWAGYLAYALFTGAVIFLAWCWPRGAAARPARRTLRAGWIALASATIAQVLLQGVYASALPLTRALDPSVVRGTLDTRFGQAAEIRLLLLAIGVPLLTLATRRIEKMGVSARLRTTLAALAYTIALAVTWAMLGHASTGIQTPLSVLSDLVHLTAMAVWLGGLAVLALLVLRLKDKPRQAATAVVRFSPLAFASVTAIIITGTYQAWRDVGSWHALFDETYGRLVLLKIAGVLCLVALGYYARTRIAQGLRPWIEAAGAQTAAPVAIPAPAPAPDDRVAATVPTRGGTSPGEADGTAAAPTSIVSASVAVGEKEAGARTALRRLRWSVAAETGIVVAVLAATSILVDSVPGRSASGIPGQPAATNTTVSFNTGTASGTVYVTVGPGVLGTNQPHILVQNPAGQPYTPAQVTAEFDLPAKSIGPLQVALTDQGEAHYIGALTQLDFTGTWQLILTIRSDAFDETTVRIPVTIVGSTTG